MRLSVAGKLLGLSVPTIRAWINRGLLDEISDSSPRLVTLQSVLEVRPLVRELRELGRDRNLLEAVLARAEDERALSDRKLRRSLDEMRSGKLIDIARRSRSRCLPQSLPATGASRAVRQAHKTALL